MTVKQASAKIDLRMNKSASGDYDNLWPYVKAEAFNQAVNSWHRRQIHGTNRTQEGDEESTIRVDDLQWLLKTDTLTVKDKGIYVQSAKLPADYNHYKRVTPVVSKGNCKNVTITSFLREEANVDLLLHIPSFDFEQTFHTLVDNRIHLYHNKDFEVSNIKIVYYRKPKIYDFKKGDDVLEFKDEIANIIVNEAARIIASDIESLNQKVLAQERVEDNN